MGSNVVNSMMDTWALYTAGAAGAVALAGLAFVGSKHPINDVATDPEDPPMFFIEPSALRTTRKLVGRKISSKVAHIGTKLYDQQTLPLATRSQDVSRVLELIASLIVELGWEIVGRNENAIQAIAITPLMRFRDDVIIEVRADAGGDAVVHMRSASRLGKSYLGANAKRIDQFLAALKSK